MGAATDELCAPERDQRERERTKDLLLGPWGFVWERLCGLWVTFFEELLKMGKLVRSDYRSFNLEHNMLEPFDIHSEYNPNVYVCSTCTIVVHVNG